MADWLIERREAAGMARENEALQALTPGATEPIKLEAQIPPKEQTPDIPGGTRSDAEIDAILASQKARPEKTVESPEVQAIRQQFKEHVAKIGTGEAALEKVGQVGRSVAEAIAPGIEVAGRAIGLDEEGAAALSKGMVEFLAGLPGQSESDLTAGMETALAALPMVGMAMKGGKIVGKAVGPAIAKEFEKAVATLKTERGSIPVGTKSKEKLPGGGNATLPLKATPTWDQAVDLDAADRTFNELVATHALKLSSARRAVRTDVLVGQEATALQQGKVTWDYLLNLEPGTTANDAMVTALKQTFKTQTEPTLALAQHVLANPNEFDAKVQLVAQLATVERGLNKIAGVFAETGRAQRQLNEVLPGTQAVTPPSMERVQIADQYIQQWLDFFKQQEALAEIGLPSKNIDDLAKIVASLKTPEQIAKLSKDMREGRLSVGDWWTSWVYFTALSNPATHMANLSGLPLMATTTIIERAIAKKIGLEAARAVILEDRLGLGVVEGEAQAMLMGMVNGLHNAVSTVSAIADRGAQLALKGKPASQLKAGDTLRGGLGAVAELLNELEHVGGGKLGEGAATRPLRSITGARAGLGEGLLSDSVDTLGLMIESPKLALAGEDAFMRTVLRDMQRGATAHRLASFKAGESIGPVYEQEFARLMESPTQGMLKEMDEFAERNTFSKALEGRMASLEHAFSSPAMKPFVMFIKTTSRIAEEGAMRTPLVGFLTSQLRDDLAAGGARRSLAMAKINFGIGLSLIATTLALEGRITGDGPANPKMRAIWLDEYQPLSFRIGDTQYQFMRNDPLALWLGQMADFVTMMRDLPEVTAQEMAVGYTMAFVNNIASKSFASSTSEFFGLFRQRGGETSAQQVLRVRQYLENQASRVAVPGLLFAIDRAYFDNVIRETRGLADKIASRSPGFSATVEPKLTYWGEVDTYDTFGPAILSHVRVKRVMNDPVNLEILKQKAEMPDLPKTVDGQQLTSKETHDLRLIFAKTLRLPIFNGQPQSLHEALATAITRPEYVNAPGPESNNLFRAIYLKSIASAYLSGAMQIMAMSNDKFLRLSQELALEEQMTGVPQAQILEGIKRSLPRQPELMPVP